MKMKTPNLKRIFLVSFLLLILVVPVYAQTMQYSIAPESSIQVDGTSNRTPEWSVHATEVSGLVSLNDEGSVESAKLVVPSKMMKSKKSPIMDRGMHEALKADDHPEIIYELTSVSEMTMTDDTTFTLITVGNLTIAAETREVAIPVEGVKKEDGNLHFSGTHALLMTDYGLKPPSLMFGAYRTGNELVIAFEVIAVPGEATLGPPPVEE